MARLALPGGVCYTLHAPPETERAGILSAQVNRGGNAQGIRREAVVPRDADCGERCSGTDAALKRMEPSSVLSASVMPAGGSSAAPLDRSSYRGFSCLFSRACCINARRKYYETQRMYTTLRFT